MRVITYSRYSTDLQSEASIVDQQRAQRELAARHGWVIAADYTDEGISGAAMGNRPGLLRALEAVSIGDVLLVADTTRLSRSQELAPLIDRLRFRGVRVIGVLDHFDSTSAHARMQAGLSGLMSDELRANIRARTHLALESRAKTARPTGGRAYGFDNAGQPVEPEAGIAREVFSRYASGEAMSAIVHDLNVRGVPSPGADWERKTRRQDGRWLISALHAILTNERYVGRVVWNKSAWVKDPDSGIRNRRERPESEWIVNEGPRLIDAATWDRTQARLKERAVSYGGNRGGQPRYLLSGVLVCGSCGGRMIIAGNKGSHYYCGTQRGSGKSACGMSLGARRDVAEERLLEPIKQDLLSPAVVDRTLVLMRQLHRQERTQGAQQPTEQMQRLTAEIADLEALIASSPTLAARLRPTLEDARRELDTLKRQAWRKSSQPGDTLPFERAYREHVARMSEILIGKDMAAARELLRAMLGDVPVRPDSTGSHLVATVNLNPMPLMKVAGIDWVGSGGLLWTQTTEIALVR